MGEFLFRTQSNRRFYIGDSSDVLNLTNQMKITNAVPGVERDRGVGVGLGVGVGVGPPAPAQYLPPVSVVIASSSSGSAKARAADRALIVGSTRRIRPWLRLFRFPSQRLQRFRWRYRFLKRSASRTCRLQSVARALRPRADHQSFPSTGPGIQTIPLAG